MTYCISTFMILFAVSAMLLSANAKSQLDQENLSSFESLVAPSSSQESTGENLPIEPAVTLLNPASGATFLTSKGLNLSLAVVLPDDLANEETKLTILMGNEKGTREISTGILTAGVGTQFRSLSIPLTDFEPGKYSLTVHISSKGTKLQDGVSILLVDPLSINFGAVVLDQAEDGLLATVKADVSGQEENRTPSRYHWTIGQYGPVVITEGPVLQYVFPNIPQDYDITIEAFEESGVSTLQTFVFGLTESDLVYFQDKGEKPKPPLKKVPAPPAKDCGCQQMIIKTQNKSGLYCAPAPQPGVLPMVDNIMCTKVAAPKPNPCAKGEVPYECPLGRAAPQFLPPFNAQGGVNIANVMKSRLSFGFEVEAVLKPNSDAALCSEGQFVQSTLMLGGRPGRNALGQLAPVGGANGVFSLPAAGGNNLNIRVIPPRLRQPVPQKGAKNAQGDELFAPDNYTKPSPVKRYHGNKKITWFDRPRTGTVMPRPPRGGIVNIFQSAATQNEFISFVKGKTGTCWCRFTLDNQWDFFNPKTTGTGITASATKPNGLNCVIR